MAMPSGETLLTGSLPGLTVGRPSVLSCLPFDCGIPFVYLVPVVVGNKSFGVPVMKTLFSIRQRWEVGFS